MSSLAYYSTTPSAQTQARSLRAPHPSKTVEGWGAHSAEKPLLAPIVGKSLRDGSCRIAVNRCRASFDGNAYLLALLCTPSCRNSPGGPPRTVPLCCDIRRRRASSDGNAYLLALLCTPSCRNSPGGLPRTVPLCCDIRRRRASFDGNAYLLALLCTLSCRNSPGGPPAPFPSTPTL